VAHISQSQSTLCNHQFTHLPLPFLFLPVSGCLVLSYFCRCFLLLWKSQIVRRQFQIICRIFIVLKSPGLLASVTEFNETLGQSYLYFVKPGRMGCHIRKMCGSNLGQGANYRDWVYRSLPQFVRLMVGSTLQQSMTNTSRARSLSAHTVILSYVQRHVTAPVNNVLTHIFHASFLYVIAYSLVMAWCEPKHVLYRMFIV
jgi:hypothetical protein